MSLIFDIEMAALQGAIHGALKPFVTAGDTTDAMATQMGSAVVDVLKMLQAAATHKPQGDVVLDAVRGALQPFVAGGDTTPAKADEIAGAVVGALKLLGAVAKAPPMAESDPS